MITKTYICDLCKKSVGEKELIELSTTISIPSHLYRKNLTIKKEICVNCLKAKDLYIPKNEEITEEKSVKNEKVLRDILIDLLVELDVSFNDHDHNY